MSAEPSTMVYIGIDVACGVGKRLPICWVAETGRMTPLVLPKALADRIPRGVGNREIAVRDPFGEAARGAVDGILHIAAEMRWRIKRIAIDAPAAPPTIGVRNCEQALGRAGLSSFRTPWAASWSDIRAMCSAHLESGFSAARLPHANKIWMLFGFALFAGLRAKLGVEVIEVYPYAIVHALIGVCEHKTTDAGYRTQLDAVAARTGWAAAELEARLKAAVAGSRHDRLDAFMAAWVASLPPDRRRAYGHADRPDDAIWVPAISAGAAGRVAEGAALFRPTKVGA